MNPAWPIRDFSIRSACLFFVAWLAFSLTAGAQDPVFEFTGHHSTEPTNWQKVENWNLNGLPAGRVPGTGPDDLVVIAGFTVSNPSYTVKDLTLTGSITGGFLNISRTMTLQGGAITACAVTILDNATFTSSFSGLNAFNSCVVYNRGTFSPLALGLGTFASEPATVITNDVTTGRIWLPDGANITSSSGGSIFSQGQFVKLAGAGTANVSGIVMTQSGGGSVQCNGGTLAFGGSAGSKFFCDQPIVTTVADAVISITGTTSELKAGANISGPGKVAIIHAIVSGAITVQNLSIGIGNILEGTGDITLTGLLEINQGSLVGDTAAANPSAQLIIQQGGTLRSFGINNSVVGRNILNSGTVEIIAAMGTPGGFATNPVLNNAASGVLSLSSLGGVGSRTIINAGTIQKITNTDLNSGILLTSGTTSNTGLIDVQTGLLKFSGYTQTAGELRVGGGAEARINSGPPSTISGGLLTGNGTLRGVSSSSALTFSGTIRPGSPIGNLTLIKGEDSIVLTAAATTEIEIGGATAGTGYDQLTLTSGFGNFLLGGKIALSFVNGFVPAVGQTFSVVRYTPGKTGAFANISGLTSIPGVVLVPRYTAAGLDLVVAPDPSSQVTPPAANSVLLSHPTAVGFSYQYEVSSDLKTWTPVGSLFAGDGQMHTVSDNAVPTGSRFYRLRVE